MFVDRLSDSGSFLLVRYLNIREAVAFVHPWLDDDVPGDARLSIAGKVRVGECQGCGVHSDRGRAMHALMRSQAQPSRDETLGDTLPHISFRIL